MAVELRASLTSKERAWNHRSNHNYAAENMKYRGQHSNYLKWKEREPTRALCPNGLAEDP